MPAVASPHSAVPATGSVLRVSPSGRPPFDVAYERRGGGEPLLLLHGIGHHWQAWEPVLNALSASYDVIAPDLPGFGTSPALPGGITYDVDGVVPALAAFIAELGVNRPHVVGNSLGGLLALELGAHGHARSVTALSPAGFWVEWERRWAFGMLRGMRAGAKVLPARAVRSLARSSAGRAALTGTIYAHPERRSPESVAAETGALRHATGFAPTLAAGRQLGTMVPGALSDIPVTVGWGDRDRLLLPRQGVRAKKTLPHARLVRLHSCGHVPMNDDPATVTRVISDTARSAVR